jgi:Leucine-rich repeat (LRR) protein
MIEDPQYIRLAGLDLTNSMFEEIVNNMSYNTKIDTRELYLNNNLLNGKISFSEFPNLTLLHCANNQIEELEEPLPKNLKNLFLYNNNFVKIPDLPQGLTYLNVQGCKLTTLPNLPNTLISLSLNYYINFDGEDSHYIDLKKLPFNVKKSIVVLLNKKDFRHDFTDNDLKIFDEFKQQQRDIFNFKHATALSKNYDELRVENRNNKKLEKLYKLFVVVNVLEFLGDK